MTKAQLRADIEKQLGCSMMLSNYTKAALRCQWAEMFKIVTTKKTLAENLQRYANDYFSAPRTGRPWKSDEC